MRWNKLKKKFELDRMTWKEIEVAYAENPVIFVPFGSMEEHGPHSVTGDYLAAHEIAKRAAERSGSYCTPVIPFGYSEYFRGFPGTISMSPESIKSVASDIIQSLFEHGIEKIILVNGHFGNASLLDEVARRYKREKGIMIGKIDLWQSISRSFKDELYGEGVNPSGHGGEPLTSVMQYLTPDDARPDLIEPSPVKKQWGDFDVTHISRVGIDDIEVSMYFDMEDLTGVGILGNPNLSSPEIGEKIVNRLADYCVTFAEKMKTAETLINKK